MDGLPAEFIQTQISALRRQIDQLALALSDDPDHAAVVRQILENPFDWELWIDPVGRCRYSSPASSQIIGYTPDELYHDATLLTRCIHPEDQQLWALHQRQILAPDYNEACTLELRLVGRDGLTRRVAHRCAPLYNHAYLYPEHLFDLGGKRAKGR